MYDFDPAPSVGGRGQSPVTMDYAPQQRERRLLLIARQATYLAPLRGLLERGLGYGVSALLGDRDAVTSAGTTGFDLILLELSDDLARGATVMNCVPRFVGATPLIVLARGAKDRDEVEALDGGASDFIRLPCPNAVLLARIRAQARQFLRSEHAELKFGPYLFRPGARELFDPMAKARIRLTRTENALLRYLYWQNGRAVSQYDLLTEVWGYNATVCSHTVQTHIYRLRKKVERDPTNPELILTASAGYVLAPHAHGHLTPLT
ncbi:MAG: response regulator transcription factor [Pseudomonadota bacterium]